MRMNFEVNKKTLWWNAFVSAWTCVSSAAVNNIDSDRNEIVFNEMAREFGTRTP